MNIMKIVVGYLRTNCYIVEKDGKCLVIDPGDDYFKIKASIKDLEVVGSEIIDHTGILQY